jgi:pilus assembly protein Flp/PilA
VKRGHITVKVGETKMTQFMSSVKNFLVSEDGPTAVEYAIMLALIVIVCIGAVQSIGTKAAAKFTAAGAALQ